MEKVWRKKKESLVQIPVTGSPGLEALVRLMKWHHDVIVPELDGLLHDLCHETKNLRSQVTRAAIQSFVKLFAHLGRDAENAKNIDSVHFSSFY